MMMGRYPNHASGGGLRLQPLTANLNGFIMLPYLRKNPVLTLIPASPRRSTVRRCASTIVNGVPSCLIALASFLPASGRRGVRRHGRVPRRAVCREHGHWPLQSSAGATRARDDAPISSRSIGPLCSSPAPSLKGVARCSRRQTVHFPRQGYCVSSVRWNDCQLCQNSCEANTGVRAPDSLRPPRSYVRSPATGSTRHHQG